MRFVEAVLLSPFFTFAVALVSLVIAPKLNSQLETALLVLSGILIGITIFRTPPISGQDLLPRILITCAITAGVGVVLCVIGGWRPILGQKPPGFLALANDAEYPSGTVLGGITWSKHFGDTRLLIVAPDEDKRDLDITIKTNAPIVAVGQMSNLDAKILPVADSTLTQQLIVGSTGKQLANPLSLIATTLGYRVQCAIGHREKLEIIIATADVIDFPTLQKPGGGIFDRDYVIKISGADTRTNEQISNWYGHGSDTNGRIEEVYKDSRHLPTAIRIDGTWGSGDDKRNINELVEVKDFVSSFLKQRPH